VLFYKNSVTVQRKEDHAKGQKVKIIIIPTEEGDIARKNPRSLEGGKRFTNGSVLSGVDGGIREYST